MEPCYIALLIYYSVPTIVMFLYRWWKTDIVIGTKGAFWDDRFDLREIATAVLFASLWPIAGFLLLDQYKLRSKHFEKLSKEILAQDLKIKQLENEIKLLKSK